MKTLWLILAVSLCGNAAQLLRSPTPTAAKKSEPGSMTASATAPHANTPATSRAPATPAMSPAWPRLHSENLETLAARLRLAGFPPHVIRAIVLAGAEKQAAAGADALYARSADTPYWRDVPRQNETEAERIYQEAQNAREALLKRVLVGEEAAPSPIHLAYLARRYGELPPEKLQRLHTLSETHQEAWNRLTMGGMATGEADNQKLAAMEREFRQELEKMLTPAELVAYDLRSSRPALLLQSKIAEFGASQAEFDALLPLYRDFDARFPPRSAASDREHFAAREQAEREMQPQIASLLGPERYADFQQAGDDPMLSRLVRRLNLPLSAARAVTATQADATQRAAAIRAEATLSPAQRDAQLATLAKTAEAQLARTLGSRGLEAYRQYNGRWLRALAPAPAAPLKSAGSP